MSWSALTPQRSVLTRTRRMNDSLHSDSLQRQPLQRLLSPQNIAVFGGNAAAEVIHQCRQLGFAGQLWPVHPTRSDLAGVACFPSFDALPGVPDAVFLGVNRHATVEAMSTVRSIGAGGAVCYGSGFAESGEADLQSDLLDGFAHFAVANQCDIHVQRLIIEVISAAK